MSQISNSGSFDISKMDVITTSFYQGNEESIQEKINDVPEKERINLDDDTIYRFSCTIEDNNKLRLKLSEIGAFAPYIYESLLTLEEIQKNYKMFRSCNDLEEVKTHINRLFQDKQIKLVKEKEGLISFKIKVFNISEIKEIEIEAKRMMTPKKDEALLKLYKIQKDQIKLLKEIENYVNNSGKNGINILEIKKKFI